MAVSLSFNQLIEPYRHLFVRYWIERDIANRDTLVGFQWVDGKNRDAFRAGDLETREQILERLSIYFSEIENASA